MLNTTLRDNTLLLLSTRPACLTYQQIEIDTNIPEGWLKRLAQRKIKDPSVNRIQTLYEYLTKSKLAI